MVVLIWYLYSVSDKNDVFNFQKPGPLGLVGSANWIVTIEWSVLKPAKISVCVTLHIRLRLTRKKSKRQYISGFFRCHVYLRISGLHTLYAYGAFFLSKFNLSLVFTNGLRFSTSRFVLFNLDIRVSTSTFVLFSLDIRFSTSTFVLFNLDIRFSTLTFVLFRRFGRELVLTLSTVFQVQHSCYSIFRSTFVFSTTAFVFEVPHSF